MHCKSPLQPYSPRLLTMAKNYLNQTLQANFHDVFFQGLKHKHKKKTLTHQANLENSKSLSEEQQTAARDCENIARLPSWRRARLSKECFEQHRCGRKKTAELDCLLSIMRYVCVGR